MAPYRIFLGFLVVICALPYHGMAQINTPSGATVPFNSNTSYQYGLMPTNLPSGGTYGQSNDAANAYNSWKSSYVQACGDGSSRVLYDNTSQTVSEGIGYGMLLAAYAADKALFDALYQYYKKWSNSNGLMNWQMNGCSSVSGYNGATDADEDAAMALVVAACQWPSATSPYTYKTEATNLITAIQSHEIDPSTNQPVNGDAWGFSNTCRNPSYFAPAYYKAFGSFVSSQSSFWNGVASEAYTLLNANMNSSTGLVSNWCDPTGTPNSCNGPNQYGFDACRNPWRMAIDVLWNNDAQAQSICSKIANYVQGQGATNVAGPVAQSGGTGTYHNAVFVSTWSAGVCGATSGYQSILNSMYSENVSVTGTSYFGTTLRVLMLFVESGNFWQPCSGGNNCSPPSAAGSISGNSTVCSGASGNTYSISAVSGATSYTWTVPSGATINSGQGTTSISVTFGNTSGTVSVTPTNSCGSGTTSSTNITISSSVAASVSASASSTTICSGSSVTFTASPTNGGSSPSYQWKKNGSNISGATSSTYTTSSITNGDQFMVVMTSNLSCVTGSPATSNTVSMTVNSSVAASVSASASSTTICPGSSVTFTASPTNGGSSPSYQWKRNGSNISGATSSTYTTSNISNGDQFVVVMTSNLSCVTGSPATSNTISMTINSSVAASVSVSASSTTICSGSSVTFKASPTNGGSSPSYQWKRNGSNISGATSSTYTTSSISNGDQFVVVMTSNLSCVTGSPATSNTVSMTVNPSVAASVSASASSTTICSGSSVTFTASPTNGGNSPSYQWKKNGSNISGATSSTYTTSSISNGDQFVVVMTSNLSCVTGSPATSNAISMAVNSSVAASVSASASATTICPGSSVTFTASPTNGGNSPSYQWKKNGSSISGATSSTYTTSNISNGDQFMVVMTSNLSCATGSPATSNTVSMTVNPSVAASVSASASSTTICSGSSVTFKASPTNGGNSPSYQWKKNGSSISGATSSTYTTSNISNGDQFVVMMTSNLSCATGSPATSNTVSMSVNPSVAASVSASASSTTICSGSSVTFTASPVNGGSSPSYQWKKNGSNISGATSSNYTTSAISNNDYFTVIMTSNALCVTGSPATSNQVKMTVNPSVTASVLVSTSSTSICSGSSVFFQASPTNGGNAPSYQWKKNGSNISGATSSTYTTSSISNNDQFTVVMTSNASCVTGSPATSNTIAMTVSSVPAANAGPDQQTCSTSTTLSGNGSAGMQSNWTLFSGAGNIVSSTSASTSVTALAQGGNIFVYTLSQNSCSSSDTVKVTSLSPSISISANANPICAGTSVTFTAVASGEGSSPVYQWELNQQPIGTNSTSYSTANLTNNDVIQCILTSSVCTSKVYSNSVAMTVSQMPDKANAGPDQYISTSSTNLQGNSPSVGNGMWTLLAGNAVIGNNSNPTTGVSNLASGANSFQWTISNGTCPSSADTVVIHVGSKPVVGSISGPAGVTTGDTAYYSVPSVSGTSYTWTVPSGATIISGQGTNQIAVIFTPATSGSLSVTETNAYGSASSTMQVSFVTAIAKAFSSTSLNIYPNPFSGQTILNTQGGMNGTFDIQITDMKGIRVFSKQGYPLNQEVELGQELDPGMYMVQVISGGQSRLVKIVKMQ